MKPISPQEDFGHPNTTELEHSINGTRWHNVLADCSLPCI